MLKKNILFLQKNNFPVLVFGILILGAFLRFVNYINRYGLASDQAQFWIVSKYALREFQLPLLGPFSSGGPFQTGGEWYWIVMLGHLLSPGSIISPWIFLTVLTLISVGIMIIVGAVFRDHKFGLILGLLIATSPVQIAQSTNLTNQTPIILLSSLSLLFMFLYIKNKQNKLFFLQILCIGIATSIHIQAVALIPFGILTGIFFVKNYIKGLLLVFGGIVIPWIPVLLADLQNDLYNTKSMLFYFTNEQAKVPYEVLGRRWLTFAGQFFPESWGQIAGGNTQLGYVSIMLVTVTALVIFFKRKLSRELFTIYVSVFVMIVILRYTRTPLFDSFFIFLHPFIFFLTGFSIYLLWNKVKLFGIILLVLYLGFSIERSYQIIKDSTNVTARETQALQKYLINQYRGQSFRIYDYGYHFTGKTLPLVMNLYNDSLLSKDGVKIGFGIATDKTSIQNEYPSLYGERGAYQLFDLSSSSSAQLERAGWAELDPGEIYNSVQHWYDTK